MNATPRSIAALAAAALSAAAIGQVPNGTNFTYQGELRLNGQPANGQFDMSFSLHTSDSGGSQVGFIQFMEDINVTSGRFTVSLDFGPQWSGFARWMQIGVRPGASSGAFTPLAPRQELTPAPYALGLALPYAGAMSSSDALVGLTQSGAGQALAAKATAGGDAIYAETSNFGDALYAKSTSTGNAVTGEATSNGHGVFGASSGTGYGVYGQSTGTATALLGYSLGTGGRAGFFRTENSTNAATTVEIQQNGAGAGLRSTARASYAGFFENTTASNTAATLRSLTNGGGSALWARTTGTASGAKIEIANSSSTAAALDVSTTGEGLAAKFTGGDVEVGGRLYAQIGTVKNRATPVAFGKFYPSPSSDDFITSSGNVTLTYEGDGTYKIKVVGEGDPETWVVVTSVSYYDVNPARKYSAYSTRPLSIAGQPGNGVFKIKSDCVSGCDNQFSIGDYVEFVVYAGWEAGD